jgi:hypothetical protein
MTRRTGAWALLLVALAASCERDADSVRAALAARQASWARQLEGIKAQHAALADRLQRQPASPANASPATLRMRARLEGARQSLTDVEIQRRQIDQQIEQALTQGGDAAEKALEEVSARMNGYFEGLTADVTAAGGELDALSKQKPSNQDE